MQSIGGYGRKKWSLNTITAPVIGWDEKRFQIRFSLRSITTAAIYRHVSLAGMGNGGMGDGGILYSHPPAVGRLQHRPLKTLMHIHRADSVLSHQSTPDAHVSAPSIERLPLCHVVPAHTYLELDEADGAVILTQHLHLLEAGLPALRKGGVNTEWCVGNKSD